VNIGFMQGRLSPIERNRIQSFPFSNWKNEFEIANEYNYQFIEWTIDSFLIEKNPIFIEEKLTEILSMMKKYSIKIESITCDFFMENPFFKTDNLSVNVIEYLLKLLKIANIIKIKYIILPLVDNSSIKNQKEKFLLIKKLEYLSQFIPKKVKILFETDFDPKENLQFINNFDRSNFGINYDTGNSAHFGYDLVAELDYYYHCIDNIHIKDRKKNSDSVNLGKGDFDFKTFFSKLIKKGYDGNLILQTARSKDDQHIYLLNKNRSYIEKYIL